MVRLISLRRFMAAAIIAMAFSASTMAQSIWTDNNAKSTIALEFNKPNFSESEGLSFFSSTLYLTGEFRVSEAFSIVGELPFQHVGGDEDGFGQSFSGNVIGNPYLGFKYHPKNSSFSTALGLRLPIAPDDEPASFIGLFTDPVDRGFEAFVPNVMAIQGLVGFHRRSESGVAIIVNGGPSWWINTDSGNDGFESDSELFLRYSTAIGYEGPVASISGGVAGRWLLTEDNGFGDNSFHELRFNAGLGSGKLRPGVYLKVPLDENVNDILNFTFGLKLLYEMN